MNQKDPIGNIIMTLLFILLLIAGIISYRSIDWDVLKRMEAVPLILPTPIPTLNTATNSAVPSASISATPQKK